jgi:hypothetical protein
MAISSDSNATPLTFSGKVSAPHANQKSIHYRRINTDADFNRLKMLIRSSPVQPSYRASFLPALEKTLFSQERASGMSVDTRWRRFHNQNEA